MSKSYLESYTGAFSYVTAYFSMWLGLRLHGDEGINDKAESVKSGAFSKLYGLNGHNLTVTRDS